MIASISHLRGGTGDPPADFHNCTPRRFALIPNGRALSPLSAAFARPAK
jgi:hypothetical protein